MTERDSSRRPKIIIIGGPNGAGKTTFAREYLPNEADCRNFVNADLIAAGLSPFDPDAELVRAGKITLEQIQWHLEAGNDFAIETTLSGKTYASLIADCRKRGYDVHLIFLKLSSSELALNRVRSRVVQGGHDVDEGVVRRRFSAGAKNFVSVYQPLVDHWSMFDISGEQPVFVEQEPSGSGEEGGLIDGAGEALKRAAEAAMEIGRRTKTPVWAVRNGMIVNLLADGQSQSEKGNEDTTLP